jgi:hypothetical protein
MLEERSDSFLVVRSLRQEALIGLGRAVGVVEGAGEHARELSEETYAALRIALGLEELLE